MTEIEELRNEYLIFKKMLPSLKYANRTMTEIEKELSNEYLFIRKILASF